MKTYTRLYVTIISGLLIAMILSSICLAQSPPGEERQLTPEQAILVERIDVSLSQAAAYLVAKQSPDGAWRSETYGMFRDGMPLTPYVMSALFFLPQGGTDAQTAFRKGVDYLMAMVNEDGTLRNSLPFPVFSAASASRMVVLETKDAVHKQAQAAFLNIIREWQLTEALGWSPDDPEYGGWGFALRPPIKPQAGQLQERFFESNLVATIFGIAAIRSARIPLSDPVWNKALVFVKRCQNFADDPAQADSRFDDGGFFFIPNDPLQNKAGITGVDRFDQQRFHSYGTMTADGLRALLQCGLSEDHPRIVAARTWLERNFSVTENPGTFNPDREVLRNATYYYWVWAVAHAFDRAGIREFEQQGKTIRWAEKLAEELIQRQQPDGTWFNRYTDAREDDPLVATPWAAAALGICRKTLTPQQDK